MNKYFELINEIKKAIETLDKEIEEEKKEFDIKQEEAKRLADKVHDIMITLEQIKERVDLIEYYQERNTFLKSFKYILKVLTSNVCANILMISLFLAGALIINPVLLTIIVGLLASIFYGRLAYKTKCYACAYLKEHTIEGEEALESKLEGELLSNNMEVNKLTYEQMCLHNKICNKITRKENLTQELERLYELMNVGVLKAVDENILNKSFDENPEVEMIRKRLNKNEFKEEK